jgi:hypothetical protein
VSRAALRAANSRGLTPVPAAAPSCHGPSDDEIAAFEDDPDGLRLTVTVGLVVRVTRAKVLDRSRERLSAHGRTP